MTNIKTADHLPTACQKKTPLYTASVHRGRKTFSLLLLKRKLLHASSFGCIKMLFARKFYQTFAVENCTMQIAHPNQRMCKDGRWKNHGIQLSLSCYPTQTFPFEFIKNFLILNQSRAGINYSLIELQQILVQ